VLDARRALSSSSSPFYEMMLGRRSVTTGARPNGQRLMFYRDSRLGRVAKGNEVARGARENAVLATIAEQRGW